MKTEDRYYVQHLTDHVFLVRERVSLDGETTSNDRLVRSFEVRHDAYMYIESINETQRKLDESYGHWMKHAV
jgi:folylpolyglutamate synthase/dihydropteroate synthase